MADEKTKVVTDATGPDADPAPAQPEVDSGTPAPKQEQPAPEVVSPDKAPAPEQAAPAQTEKDADAPMEQKAASVSVFNFSEIMAEKKAAEKAAAQQEAKTPDKVAPTSPSKEDGPKQEKPKEQEQAPKRRGRPPKADKAAAPAQKEAPGKKDKAVQKSAQPGKTEKAAPSGKTEKAPKASSPAKGAPEVNAPVQAETPAAPAEAPRPVKDEQIVYIKLSELHAFKNHPFQVRNDEEMKAMVSSVRDKGVTQPAIVRPREDGGYEIVSGHRRQKASELVGFTDMPCIVRSLTDEQAITQMVEDNIPGWTIFPRNTVFPMSTPGTRRRKHAPSWRQSSSSRRLRLCPTRTRQGLPMRNGRPRAKLARGSTIRAAPRGPPGFPKFPGGKEAVCRNM